jgi:hypothetical protein
LGQPFPLQIWDPSFINIYKASHPYQYDMWMTLLASPTATISLFDHFLHDHLQWPFNDHAAKQHIFMETLSPQQVIKTGWSTTLVMGGIDEMLAVHSDSGEVGDDDEYQMVGVEMSSEKTDSTVDSVIPTLLPGGIRR